MAVSESVLAIKCSAERFQTPQGRRQREKKKERVLVRDIEEEHLTGGTTGWVDVQIKPTTTTTS